MSSTLIAPQPQSRTLPPPAESERPARVLHVIPELSSGGMELAMMRLIRRSLLQDRESVSGSGVIHGVCVLREGGDHLREQCPREIPTWVLRDRRLLRRCRAWMDLRRVINSFQPDVIHARSTGTWFDAASAAAGRPRTRLLLSFHGRTTLEDPGLRRRMVDRWATGRAHAVLTVSRDAAGALHEELQVPADKLTTIHNGVDTSLFNPADSDVEVQLIRRRLKLETEADVAICVANLLPIKGIDVLVRAWRQVHMANPLARLLLVGQGPLYGELSELIRSSRCGPVIRLLGAREDIPDLLRAADVFVLPSRYEGCSNATLEAMASGLPVLACNVGGMPEIVSHNYTGWLVPAGSVESLANTLLAALLDRIVRNRTGSAGRDTAVKHFGIDTWVARHTALYRRLAGLAPHRCRAREDAECAE